MPNLKPRIENLEDALLAIYDFMKAAEDAIQDLQKFSMLLGGRIDELLKERVGEAAPEAPESAGPDSEGPSE
jgi:hypothetical protein